MLVIKKNQKLRAILIRLNKHQTAICASYTKGVSSTESLINHLKSKHRIHAILESEDHKLYIPAQEEIRSQIVIKEMSLFEATKKRSNKLEELHHALITIKSTSVEPERAVSAMRICHKTQKQAE